MTERTNKQQRYSIICVFNKYTVVVVVYIYKIATLGGVGSRWGLIFTDLFIHILRVGFHTHLQYKQWISETLFIFPNDAYIPLYLFSKKISSGSSGC